MHTNPLFPTIKSDESGEIVEEMDHGLFPSFLSTNNNNNTITTKNSDSDFSSNHENLHSNLHSRQTRDDENSEGVRFPEIPNFIEAIFTLLVCGFLLAAILILIKKAKIWCASRHHGDEEDPVELSTASSNNKSSNVNNSKESNGVDKIPQNGNHSHTLDPDPDPNSNSNSKVTSKLQVIENDESSQAKSEDSAATYSRQSSSQSKDSRNSTKKGNQKSQGPGKSPNRVSFVRRLSGPFGDECLEFVGETYKKLPEKKHYEEKESRTKRMSVRRLTKKSTDPQQKRRTGECDGDKSGGESRSSSRLDEGAEPNSNPASPTPSSEKES